MQLREALDVHLVDDRLVPRRARRPVVAPGERRIDDRRQRRERRVVALVERQVGVAGRRSCSRTARRPSGSVAPIAFAYGSRTTLFGLKRWPVRRARTGRGRGSRRAGPAGRRAGSRARPCRSARAAGCARVSSVASGESNRHSSTLVACAEKSAKLTPTPFQVAPSGYGSPGQTRTDGARGCAMSECQLGRTTCRGTDGQWAWASRSADLGPPLNSVEYRSLNHGSAEFE